MPRFSATSTEQMFVDSTKPPKENRRDTLRHKILVPASVLQKDQEAKMVKVVNLGLGGCKFVGHDKLSIHKVIMISFICKLLMKNGELVHQLTPRFYSCAKE